MTGPAFPQLTDIRAALVAAEDAVAEVAGATSRGAGSTVAGIALVEYEGEVQWLVFNVGDSRVYRHVGSELEQLTVDHSLGQELVDRGGTVGVAPIGSLDWVEVDDDDDLARAREIECRY